MAYILEIEEDNFSDNKNWTFIIHNISLPQSQIQFTPP
jgi:hypothetical protein